MQLYDLKDTMPTHNDWLCRDFQPYECSIDIPSRLLGGLITVYLSC